MPVALEHRLRREAHRKGLTGEAADAYVYGTMNNAGLMHGNKETAKGRKADVQSSGMKWRDRKKRA